MSCAICQFQTKSGQALAGHVRAVHSLSSMVYYLYHVKKSGPFCVCGREKQFLGITKGYRKFCSNSCSAHKNRAGVQTGRVMQVKVCCETCGNFYKTTTKRQRFCYVCAPTKQARSRLVRYGLTQESYDGLLSRQNDHCALCPKKIQAIDHCHSTGRVRGLLCVGCNVALNRVENKEWIRKAQTYLEAG